MAELNKDSWHLQKSVSIGLLVGVFMNLGAGVWYASQINSQMLDHERRITVIEHFDGDVDHELKNIGERLSHLETKTEDEVSALNRIELILGNSHVYRKREDN